MKLLLVVWEDITMEEGGPWVFVEHAVPVPPKVFYQVGWLYKETPEYIELTSAIQEGGLGIMAAREHIARGVIHSITELEPASKQSKRSKRSKR
jgi:hypothetical protein